MRVLSAVILFHIAIWQIVGAQRSKIVNGQTTVNSDVPYIVYLKHKGTFFCGGTMVSATHVVTAAHCMANKRAIDVTVTGGATYLQSGGYTRQVEKMVMPTAYSSRTMNRDVAVLKLKTAMPSSVKALPLCTKTIAKGDLMKISGWGSVREGSSSLSAQVQTFTKPVVDKGFCTRRYRLSGTTITNDMFCVATHGKQDSCQGDSGGPAVHNGQLCGVVSWGNGCARNGFPGVYTDVKKVTPFIRKAMTL